MTFTPRRFASFARVFPTAPLAAFWTMKSGGGAAYVSRSAIALSGDGSTLAVASNFEDSGATGINGNEEDESASGAGAVYVFVRNGTTWSQQAYIKASNAAEGDRFGYSLALSDDGSTLAVGAIGYLVALRTFVRRDLPAPL